MPPATEYARAVVDRGALAKLIPSLESRGYQVVGPVLRDGAIVYDTLKSLDDLPAGWTEEQQPGQYRLRKREDGALFGYTVGPQSWKKFFHPPEVRLFQVQRNNGTFHILEEAGPPPRYALLGVRACELAAIEAQDRVLAQGRFADAVYRARRQQAFIVAVNCTQAAPTCFCASMHTGPRTASGFDLALTEILENGASHFVVDAGSDRGAEILRQIGSHPASPEICRKAEEAIARAAQQSRGIDINGLHDQLAESFDHPRWDDIARRCLTCGNCTLVCPTCFCTTVEDTSDVAGQHAERWRKWDSCFTQTFSYIHGGSVRQSAKSRYRQWMMHKLAFWTDQFGGSGCVGCGRCITWCPAAIDITEEARAIREPIPVSTTQSREKDDGNT
ncbi:MAG TPA: 4Fe-4S dicluster domain-containing protein [Bryobacteraceae bacterium]|jgi:ferredoxin